ncbi:aluminum-activated malate transporter 2-like [Momordica charantia]|uniref:Aluminum-activated malate transporter 2-like n=1 Tax=Momordica charantia TaxID=3673 RepID=A0A6J1CJE7_MOMCH|nr:aluminum-activated malate transporter 2-like [Momordica charantia]
MEMADHKSEGVSSARWAEGLRAKSSRLTVKVGELARKTKKLAKDDPRRIAHSLKVALAITLVSLFYYFEPLYDGFGASAMWAILTVVVVFEFSVGATLGRGLNRVLATFSAAALGFGAHFLADLAADKGEPIILAFFVFLLAATTTFVRFFPRIKARYDYGFLIFILTFCLVSVSGYRDDEILQVAYTRALTILIGTFIAILICIFICPVWAGEDLHSLVSNNVELLGNFLQGFGARYSDEWKGDKQVEGCKSVLTSRQTEESLVNFARWEPGHGSFKFRHPWKQYRKIGSLTRQCAYRLESLNGYLTTETQIPLHIRDQLKDSCSKMSIESGKALKDLASAIRTMTRPTFPNPHVEKSKAAAKNLKVALKIGPCNDGIDLLEIVPAATVASLLIDSISCIEKIAESVGELASMAQFKKCVEAGKLAGLELEQDQQQNLPTPAIVNGHCHVVL